ncbi:transposase [Methylocapsa sp. S129]|uniref:transposase n=1 Tax=Methylocapsa sp. S129 TaxID=1641869 RepID=UPI001FEDABD6|nr:transposase [Methylocapsa sp. S129]
MTRIARIVVPGLPHHVTQRGNRRERIFFEDSDYALYRDWLAQSCRQFGVSCWAYCLMPNHVHLILTPEDSSGLALAHRLYAGYVNARARQTGHLFQGRFGSVVMDEDHLMVAARYVALNPVRARRRAGQRAAVARPGAALRRSSGQRARLGFIRAASPQRAHRPPARRARLHGGDRSPTRPRRDAGQARAQAERQGKA